MMNYLSYKQYHKLPDSIDRRDKFAGVVSALIREENTSLWNKIIESPAANSSELKELYSSGIIKCNISNDYLTGILKKSSYFRKFNDKNKRTCDITNYLDHEDIAPLILDTGLLCLISNYLGAPARLQKYTLSWSNTGETQQELNPQKFHRDRDDFRTLQLFIYLTNVAQANGPHEYVPKTHSLEILRKFYLENSISNGLDHRFLGLSELKKALGAKNPVILTLKGPAGSAFLEDTGGFHRGTVPHASNTPRLMLGITWSLGKGTGFVNIGKHQLKILHNTHTITKNQLNDVQKYSVWL